MAAGIRIVIGLLVGSLAAATPPVSGAEPNEDMLMTARILAAQEAPVAKRDLRGFCAATYGSPDYAGYSARACQLSVTNNMKKAADCTEASIRAEIQKDTDRCLAMSKEAFDKQILTQRKAQADFVADAKKAGIDGEKLLSEERAKLK